MILEYEHQNHLSVQVKWLMDKGYYNKFVQFRVLLELEREKQARKIMEQKYDSQEYQKLNKDQDETKTEYIDRYEAQQKRLDELDEQR